jgi:hypothetical protein
MTKQKEHEPEFGQHLHNNVEPQELDLGEHERYVSNRLYALSEALGLRNPTNQSHGLLGGTWGYGQDYTNDVFEMHPYWWGDCTCGMEGQVVAWEQANPHPPGCVYHYVSSKMEEIRETKGMKEGLITGSPREKAEAAFVEELRARFPHMVPVGEQGWLGQVFDLCDCGQRARYEEFARAHRCKDDCRLALPNFRCGDVEISWYKYIGRSMSVNRQVSRGELEDMFEKCFASLPPLSEEDKKAAEAVEQAHGALVESSLQGMASAVEKEVGEPVRVILPGNEEQRGKGN